MKEKSFVSAVVYCRGSGEQAAGFIDLLASELCRCFENFEIIAVDDGGKDDLLSFFKPVAEKYAGAFSVVRMSFPQGVQAAMNAGVDLAIGDFVFEFESTSADYDMELVFEVYQYALRGFDIVGAVPRAGRRVSSRLFYWFYNKNARGPYPLSGERFRIVSRRAVNRVESMSDHLIYRQAFYKNSGLKCGQLPYDAKTIRGESPLPEERSRLAADSLVLFTDLAYKLSLMMSAVMMLFAVFSGVYALVIFLLGRPVEGWTTTMLFLSFAFLGVFGILTVIVKYLSVLVDLVFRKNRYSVETVVKIA